MKLKLVFPALEHASLWKELVEAIENAGEKIIPYALTLELKDYATYLERTLSYHEGRGVPESFVPASTYFLMDEEETRLIGAVNIRHRLNAFLLEKGGHVGYGIHPSERRKGYATVILRLALEKCKVLGIDRVLVTCDRTNIGSAKTILINSGVLESEIIEDSGNIVQRYWIQNI